MEVDRLLSDLQGGKKEAYNRLCSLAYDHLLMLAEQQLSREYENPGVTSKELVHEMFEKMARQKKFYVNNLSHFYALSVCMMQQVLVDLARKRNCLKKGRGWMRVEVDLRKLSADHSAEDVKALLQVLNDLKSIDKQCYRVVQLRYFAGLTIWETACAMDISTSTANRYWKKARCWMRKQMSDS